MIRTQKGLSRMIAGGLIFAALSTSFTTSQLAFAQYQDLSQNLRCDPTKVLTADSCARCHAHEVQAWQKTPHFQTFEKMHRNPRAQEIAAKLGLRSIKRSDVCINCHYTMQQVGDSLRAVSGVSCESCHGAAKDWIELHNDYGGPTATKASESAIHREQRVANSIQKGMRNPGNLYLVARSCLECHTVPNESLVNVGGHHAGSADFEFVSWSQGTVRHNFLRTDGQHNATNSLEQLRVMYIVGQIADLEFSTRATAHATSKATYGLASAQRAARTAVSLLEIQQKINDAHLELILQAFAHAELRINNREQLEAIADQIGGWGFEFAQIANGSELGAIDDLLPKSTHYR